MTNSMFRCIKVPILCLLLAGCRDEEPEPDVQAIVGDFCDVYQSCEPETPYSSAEDCELRQRIDVEAADAACRRVELVYYECLGSLTCAEYTALRQLESGAPCADEQLAYVLECEF